ncbi:UNVERIFIED_CONTAM: hypothetical protein FKN15_021938 [Acipenser sinensis]
MLNTLIHHCEAVLHLRFSNGMMVTCSKDRSIAVWDMASPTDITLRRVLVGHRAAVNVVDFDDKYIVSASGDRTIKVWNSGTCEFVRTLNGHKRGIACLQYRDRLVVSGSSDNMIRLWDIECGACLRVLEGHEELVRCIRFDNKRIVSGAYDGKIKVWDLVAALDPRAPAGTLCLRTLVHIKEFYNRTWLSRNHTGLSEETLTLLYSFTVSVFAIGGLLGSLLVGMLVTKFGRYGSVFPSGICLSVVPMYLGEIAPKNLRGFLALVPSIFICLGVFLAQVLGLEELLGKEAYWPLFLSLVVVPTFIQLMLLPWFPESPRYLLIEKRNIHATITALKWYRSKCNIQAEIEEMQEEQHSLSTVETVSVWGLMMDKSVRWQFISVIVINMGMQLSGIDAIWFYTNAIFANAGIPKPQIQYTTVGTGAIEVISGLIGCFTIEKLGRRPLMIGGFSVMGIGCAGITLSLVLQMSAGSFCYLVFCGICVLVAVYVHFVIPETKNKTFVEISQMFATKEPILSKSPSGNPDELKLKKFNGYGTLENSSVELDSSRSYP